jgi:S1-C subfamily serine protease
VGPLCDRYGFECSIGGDGFGSSDQSAFFAADIPVLHFFTGTHSEYHKPSDDADLINAEGAVRVAWLVSDVAGSVANRPGELTLVKTSDGPQRRMALKARLGTIPDYAGPPDGSPGLLLSDVRPDSPAEAAGLQRGDVIVQIGEMEIAGVQDYMVVLSEANPGDSAPVVVVRDGERVEMEVTFGAPR